MSIKTAGVKLAQIIEYIGVWILALMAAAMLIYTCLSIFAITPWPYIPMGTQDNIVFNSGPSLQVILTVALIAFSAMIPFRAKLLALGATKVKHNLSMNDVARAYIIAHQADRDEVFVMLSEYDSMKERITYLEEQPSLEKVTRKSIELAAEMSHHSRKVAKKFTKKKQDEANAALTQLRKVVEAAEKAVADATPITDDIKSQCNDIIRRGELVEAEIDRQQEVLDEARSYIHPIAEDSQEMEATVVSIAKTATE